MIMNYREKMREDIKCPQFGNITYGRLGTLRYEDRKSIKRLLDEMDRADEIIKKQFFELDKQKEILDKIKEKVNQYEFISGYYDDNYDGEDTTYSHDTLKEDILELLEEIE